jgi:hypothetical protein
MFAPPPEDVTVELFEQAQKMVAKTTANRPAAIRLILFI